jgi:hypothetical protein
MATPVSNILIAQGNLTVVRTEGQITQVVPSAAFISESVPMLLAVIRQRHMVAHPEETEIVVVLCQETNDEDANSGGYTFRGLAQSINNYTESMSGSGSKALGGDDCAKAYVEPFTAAQSASWLVFEFSQNTINPAYYRVSVTF